MSEVKKYQVFRFLWKLEFKHTLGALPIKTSCIGCELGGDTPCGYQGSSRRGELPGCQLQGFGGGMWCPTGSVFSSGAGAASLTSSAS